MKRAVQLLVAMIALQVVVAAVWTAAFLFIAPPAERQQSTPYRQLPATIDNAPSTIDARYVASTLDRNERKRYHLPGCSYVRLLKHGRGFDSEADAKAAGYEPCSRCLSPKIVRAK